MPTGDAAPPRVPALVQLIEAARAPLTSWPVRFPSYRAMGIMCSYVPEEMVHGAGFAPVRVRGTAAPLRRVDTHLQSFACALCRSTLDQLLVGELDFLAGTLFAHSCDAMQAQADLWRLCANGSESHLVDTVMQPAHLGSPAARSYLMAELGRFRDRLAAFSGRAIGEDALRESISLHDETRQMVQALDSRREWLSAAEFYAILDAAQIMPREVFNPLLGQLLEELEPAGSRQRGPRPRLFLTGAVLDEPRLLDLIDDVGAGVVGDDLCSGSRHFRDLVGARGDPIANLVDHSLRRPPCPSKYHPGYEPGAYLLELAVGAQADGLIFVLEKFCEPHAFDHALARPALDDAGMPYLVLEMEQTPSLEALRTRLQAFVEML